QQSTRFPNAPVGELFPGDPQAPVGSNFPDKNDWAPRFGFAWDPKSDGKMSIRGGFGVFYDILKGEDNLQFNGQAPFFGFADLIFNPLSGNPTKESNYMSQPFVAAGQPNPFPSQPPPASLNFAKAGFLPIGGTAVYFVDPHLRTPYIYQYNLDVQRQIFANTTLDVAYIGSSSHKLTGLLDSNPFVLGTTKRLFDTQSPSSPGTFSYLDTFATWRMHTTTPWPSVFVSACRIRSTWVRLNTNSRTHTVSPSITHLVSVRAIPAYQPIIGDSFGLPPISI